MKAIASLRSAALSSRPSAASAFPRTVTVPALGSRRPPRRWSSVVFPDPEGRYPEVELSLTEHDPLASLARVKSGELDLALMYEYDFVPFPRTIRSSRRSSWTIRSASSSRRGIAPPADALSA
jgi:hypothetical protein